MSRLLTGIAVVFLAAAAALAALYSDEMTALRAALDARLAGLAGMNDPASKAQANALKGALKKLDKKPSLTLDSDVALLASISQKIEEAFVVEDADLVAALTGLLGEGKARRDAFVIEVEELPFGPTRDKLQTAVTAMDPLFDEASAAPGPDTSVTRRAKALKAALKRLGKAIKKLDKFLGSCPAGAASAFSYTVDGQAVTGPSQSGVIEDGDEITVAGFLQDSGGVVLQKVTLAFSPGHFTGPGNYAVAPEFGGPGRYVIVDLSGDTDGSASLATSYFTSSTGGGVTVTNFDLAKRTIAGRFDLRFEVYFANDRGTKLPRHVVGRFRDCALQDLR